MAVCARVKWLARAACESGAHRPPRREHTPPPRVWHAWGGGGGRCVGTVDTMACMALAMAIMQLYDTAAGSRGGPIARTGRRGPTRRACHGPTEPGANGDGCAMGAGGGDDSMVLHHASGPPVRSAVRPGARPRVHPPRRRGMGGTPAPARENLFAGPRVNPAKYQKQSV